MKYWVASLVGIFALAMFSSCTAPTLPMPAPSTLTILLPDSAHAFDTITFRVHYSDSILPSWKFEWQFGDSSRATTTDTSVEHVYDSAGTYNVRVTLIDSAGNTIAKQSGSIQVFAAFHFNLTLLQMMHSASIECYGIMDSSWYGQTEGQNTSGSIKKLYNSHMEFQNITWSVAGFNESYFASSKNDDSDGWPRNWPTYEWSNGDTMSGSLDPSYREINNFECQLSNFNWNYFSSQIAGDKSGSDFILGVNASHIYFKGESDTEVVFEEVHPSANFYQEADSQWAARTGGWAHSTSTIGFTDTSVIPYIIIRFHN